jgi:hypothetical protein
VAPNASAERTSVPAFPGSLRSARTSTGPAPSSTACAVCRRIGATARMPLGASTSESAATVWSSIVKVGVPRCSRSRTAGVSEWARGVTYNASMGTPARRASSSSVAPSRTKRPCSRRPLTVLSARSAVIRGARLPSVTGNDGLPLPHARRPGARSDHDQSGEQRRQCDRDLVVEMVRHEQDHQQVDDHDEDRDEKREPADFGEHGRTWAQQGGYEARRDGSAKVSRRDERSARKRSIRTRIFDGRVFNVRVDELRYDDGSQHRSTSSSIPSFTSWPHTAPGELVVLVRQYRHPAKRSFGSSRPGPPEAGEDPATGAMRELARGDRISGRGTRAFESGHSSSTPGFCDENDAFFLCRFPSGRTSARRGRAHRSAHGDALDEAWRLVASRARSATCKTVLGLLWMRAGKDGIRTDLTVAHR